MTLTYTPACSTSNPARFEDEATGRGYSVMQDDAASDPRSNIDDEHAALWAYRVPTHGGSVAQDLPSGNIAIDAFARFYESFEDHAALTMTQRYLRIFHPESTRTVGISTVRGHSQGDWLDLVCAVADGYGTPDGHMNEFAMWAYGNVWTVIPDDGDSLSGIYADDDEAALDLFRRDYEVLSFDHNIELRITANDSDESLKKLEQVIAMLTRENGLPSGVFVHAYTPAIDVLTEGSPE